jgi:hypothetical protein
MSVCLPNIKLALTERRVAPLELFRVVIIPRNSVGAGRMSVPNCRHALRALAEFVDQQSSASSTPALGPIYPIALQRVAHFQFTLPLLDVASAELFC